MRDLKKDAEDPFLSALENASDENIEQFVNDTVQRGFARDTAGDHTANLERIKTAQTTWREGRSKTDLGNQKSATGGVVLTITTIKQTSRELFVDVQSKFGIASLKLLEFFPKGLTEINNAGHGDFAQILTRFKNKAELYKTTLGQPWADRTAALFVGWEGSKEIQSGEKSGVKEGAANRDNTLPELAKALTAHYLHVRQKNEANPSSAVGIYFDESPLNRSRGTGNPDEDGLGRLIVLAQLADGTPVSNADVKYKNTRTGKSFTGKTDANGRFRSSNQSIGLVEGKVTTESGQIANFSLEIQDDSDPVNVLVLS